MAINNVNKLKNLYKKVAPHICKSSRTTTNTYATKNKVKYTRAITTDSQILSSHLLGKRGKKPKKEEVPRKFLRTLQSIGNGLDHADRICPGNVRFQNHVSGHGSRCHRSGLASKSRSCGCNN